MTCGELAQDSKKQWNKVYDTFKNLVGACYDLDASPGESHFEKVKERISELTQDLSGLYGTIGTGAQDALWLGYALCARKANRQDLMDAEPEAQKALACYEAERILEGRPVG